jgi:hypothetical protein
MKIRSIFFVACFVSSVVLAQEVGKIVDPRPLERPRPLCSIKGTDIRPTLQLVVTSLGQGGYSIDQTDWDKGEVQARRLGADGEDRIIAWLERDIAKPTTQFCIYLVAGRYEKFFGATELRRVLLNTTKEQQQFGPVRQLILNVALSQG